MELTKEQRVMNVIKRQPVDYLPSHINIADRTRYDEIARVLGLDGAEALDDFLQNHMAFPAAKEDMPIFHRDIIPLMRSIEAEGFVGVDEEGGTVYDRWGMGIQMRVGSYNVNYGFLEGLKEKNEIAKKFLPPDVDQSLMDMDFVDAVKKYKAPDPHKPTNFDPMQEELKKLKNVRFAYPDGFIGIYERAYGIVGFQNLLVEMMDHPTAVREFFEKITDNRVESAKLKLKAGAIAGHIGDDLGTQRGAIFSLEIFRELLLPCYKRLFAVFKDAGVPMMMHSCGHIEDVLPDLINIGLDVIEPVQPCNDLRKLKREYGKDITFYGGIDTQKLTHMKPDQVREMTRETIEILGEGGGHIIAPAQELMNDCPIENIAAIVGTVMEMREKMAN